MSYDPSQPTPAPRPDGMAVPMSAPSTMPPTSTTPPPGPRFSPNPAPPAPTQPGATPTWPPTNPYVPGTAAPGSPGVPSVSSRAMPSGYPPQPVSPDYSASVYGPAKSISPVFIGSWVAIGLAFIASFLPWATVIGISIEGTRGDGKLTALLTLLAAILFGVAKAHSREIKRGFVIGSLIAMVPALLIYIYDLINIARIGGSNDPNAFIQISVSPGIGLYLGVLASIAAIVMLALILKDQS